MRTRYTLLAIGILFVTTALTACGQSHEHTWKDASCTEAKVCTECGETEGEALGHKWTEATCVEPKTCSVCGETEGTALDHKWTEARCVEPKTCSVCGETEGEALGHDLTSPTFEEPATCKICGTTEGGKYVLEEYDMGFLGKNSFATRNNRFVDMYLEYGLIRATIYDMEGNVVGTVELSDDAYTGASYWTKANCIMLKGFSSKGNVAKAFDCDGNEIDMPSEVVESLNTSIEVPDVNIYECWDDNWDFIGALDYENKKWIDKEIYGESTQSLPHKSSSYEINASMVLREPYLVYTDSEWGYIDKDGNILGMYADTSGFSNDGIAFVSEDGKSYSAIDRDFNVIGVNLIDGAEADTLGGHIFKFEDSKGTKKYYRVVMEEVAEESAESESGEANSEENFEVENEANSENSSSAKGETVNIDDIKENKTILTVGTIIEVPEGNEVGINYYSAESRSLLGSSDSGNQYTNTIEVGGDYYNTYDGTTQEDIRKVEKWYVTKIKRDSYIIWVEDAEPLHGWSGE